MDTSTRRRECADCVAGLEHCHGVAIVHLGGANDCTDELGCTVASECHEFVALCDVPTCCTWGG